MTEITVYFHGRPGGTLDAKLEAIVTEHGGQVVASGNLLVGPHAGQRDVQAEVPPRRVDACCQALRQAGFTKIEVN